MPKSFFQLRITVTVTVTHPMAKTKQEKRRAKCKNMFYPEASQYTLPYSFSLGCSRRRPKGEFGIEAHQQAGRIIKAAISSKFTPYGARRRLHSLRSDLECWLNCEIGRGQLEGPDFFDVYFGSTDEDRTFQEKAQTVGQIVKMLQELTSMLKQAYPDCAPLRKQIRKIEMSASMIAKNG